MKPERKNLRKISLIASFLEIEGDVDITLRSMEKNGSVRFSGNMHGKRIKFTMDKYQLEELDSCEDILSAYDCYRNMGYFQEV